jgi:lipopolysaccharide assembly protein A
MRIVSTIITLGIILIGAAFTALNAQHVEINYLIGTRELPLAVILLIALALGVVLSILTMGFSLIKLKAKNKWLEIKLNNIQTHVHNP